MSGQQLHRVYIDDSGEKEYGANTSRYFVYAGVVLSAADEPACNAEIERLKVKVFGCPDVELKSNWLRIGRERERRYLRPYSLTDAQLNGFVDELYCWMARCPVQYVAAAIDKVQMKAKYVTPWHPSSTGYQFLLQRYQKHLLRVNGFGHVTMDDMDGASPAHNQWRDLLRNQHARLKKDGCSLTKLRFDNVAQTLRFGDSKKFHLLQIADLVAYNVLRQFRDHGENWDDPAKGDLPMYARLKPLLPRFMRGPEPTNQLQGWGVVKWPSGHKGRWCLTPEELRGA
jgi:hypothetical protein